MPGIRSSLAAIALLALLALVAASLLAGTPEKLPSLALGAPWLLHVERVVAGAIAGSVIVTIIVRSAGGQLPLKLGATSIEFESLKASATEGIDTMGMALATLAERIDRLEAKS
jgi:hypothetical protein